MEHEFGTCGNTFEGFLVDTELIDTFVTAPAEVDNLVEDHVFNMGCGDDSDFIGNFTI